MNCVRNRFKILIFFYTINNILKKIDTSITIRLKLNLEIPDKVLFISDKHPNTHNSDVERDWLDGGVLVSIPISIQPCDPCEIIFPFSIFFKWLQTICKSILFFCDLSCQSVIACERSIESENIFSHHHNIVRNYSPNRKRKNTQLEKHAPSLSLF
jgi:hypothetical protein